MIWKAAESMLKEEKLPKKPTVSVVIVNYNSGHLLKESVRGALAQAEEVLIVDNASSDNSISLCTNEFAGERRVKVVQNQTNLGFATACNQGYRKSTGEAVLFLNPDCRLEGRAIPRLLEVLQADAAVGMVGGFLCGEDLAEQKGGRRAVPTPWRSFVRLSGLYRLARYWPRLFFDFALHRQPLPSSPTEVEAISGACMLVKRSAIKDVGLWDEGYFLHCEDLDWCMRFRQQGWNILFVPDAIVIHQQGGCSHARPVFVEWHKHRGMVRYYQKFFRQQYSGIMLPVVLSGVWVRFFAVLCYYSMKRLFRFLRRDDC